MNRPLIIVLISIFGLLGAALAIKSLRHPISAQEFFPGGEVKVEKPKEEKVKIEGWVVTYDEGGDKLVPISEIKNLCGLYRKFKQNEDYKPNISDCNDSAKSLSIPINNGRYSIEFDKKYENDGFDIVFVIPGDTKYKIKKVISDVGNLDLPTEPTGWFDVYGSFISEPIRNNIVNMYVKKKTEPAVTIGVVADEGALSEGRGYEALLRSVPPFNTFGKKLKIKVVPVLSVNLKCVSDTSSSILDCERSFLDLLLVKHDLTFALVVTSKIEGRANAPTPYAFVTAENNYKTWVHETGHLFNLGDEYPSGLEHLENGSLICKAGIRSKQWPNIIYISKYGEEPLYELDKQARDQLGPLIPWFNKIPIKTAITREIIYYKEGKDIPKNGKKVRILGSKEAYTELNKHEAGLYHGGPCGHVFKFLEDDAFRPYLYDGYKIKGLQRTWTPYQATIMRYSQALNNVEDFFPPIHSEIIINQFEDYYKASVAENL